MKLPPPTRYVRNDEVNIAYQVFGQGDFTLVHSPGAFSHIEVIWELPSWFALMSMLSKLCQVIVFDKRGMGMSDHPSGAVTVDDMASDIIAIMDKESVERAVLLGISEGGTVCLQGAASYPERVERVIVYGAFATGRSSTGVPCFMPQDTSGDLMKAAYTAWGDGHLLHLFAPSLTQDPANIEWFGKYQRMATSPGGMKALIDNLGAADITGSLASIEAPTLVLHARGDRVVDVANGRYLAEHIPNVRYKELDS